MTPLARGGAQLEHQRARGPIDQMARGAERRLPEPARPERPAPMPAARPHDVGPAADAAAPRLSAHPERHQRRWRIVAISSRQPAELPVPERLGVVDRPLPEQPPRFGDERAARELPPGRGRDVLGERRQRKRPRRGPRPLRQTREVVGALHVRRRVGAGEDEQRRGHVEVELHGPVVRLRREDRPVLEELVRAAELLDETIRQHPPGVFAGDVGGRELGDEPEHRRFPVDGLTGRAELVGEDAGRQAAQVGAPDRAQRDLGAEPTPPKPRLDLLADQREVRRGRRCGPVVEDEQQLRVAQQPAPPLGLDERPLVARQAAGEHDRAQALAIHLPAEARTLLADHGLHGRRPRRESARW